MLRSGRKRQQEFAAREAAGESLWTDEFSPEVRVKIKMAMADTIGYSENSIYMQARGLLVRQHGQERFTTKATNDVGGFIGALTIGYDDMVADGVEAFYAALHQAANAWNIAEVPQN